MTNEILSLPNWATTAKNTPISLFSWTNFKAKERLRPILFIGGVHGDEPEGVILANELLNYLKLAPPCALPWLLIPCINPDAYSLQQRTNSNGVDLNRNFPDKHWQPFFSQARYYPGSRPGSELETQALVQLIKQQQPCLIVHFHSWQPCIVYTGETALVDAKRLASASNYPLKSDIGYPTPGSLGQYAGMDLSIPVICIEEQEGKEQESIWHKFKPAFELMLYSPAQKLIPGGAN